MVHLIQAAIEGVKAVESVIDEMSKVGENEKPDANPGRAERIDVE